MPKLKDIILVSIQVALMLSYFLNVEWFSMTLLEHHLWFYFGILGLGYSVIGLLQLNIHLSPFPTPKDDSKLITNGAFYLSRHPIYTGILIFMFCMSFWLGEFYKLFISVLTFALFYYKSNYEEHLLENAFPEYKTYKKRTGRFLPKINFNSSNS